MFRKRRGGTRAAMSVARVPPSRSRSCGLLDVLVDELGHLEHRDLALATEDGLELVVGVDHATLFRVLKPVALDVLPELLRDLRARHRAVAHDSGKLSVGLHRPHERRVRRALRTAALRLLRALLRSALLRAALGAALLRAAFSAGLLSTLLCSHSLSR